MANFSDEAIQILESRYLKKDKDGNVVESPDQMLERVANHIASAEKEEDRKKWYKRFLDIMDSLEFLPNSPTLMNSNARTFQLSACFCLPVEDDLAAIFEVVKQSALIHKTGGGTGFSFSRLRPKGSIVGSTQGVASGPISFMSAFDAVTETVKQGGVRRGANLGLLDISHPDIYDFVKCKANLTSLQNFNISVGMKGEFLKRSKSGSKHFLVNPSNKEDRKSVDANELLDLICFNIWEHGEPGIIFLDVINSKNPIPWMGRIESTNPCISGDTLIAVADGRGSVTIKQLAEEKDDVPVYCSDSSGKVHIRYGRNPIKTGINKEIYSILLDDGTEVKATGNHNFILSNGEFKQVTDLQVGDSLRRFDKYQFSYGGKKTKYWGVQKARRGTYQEHKLIYEFYSRRYLIPEETIHHVDMDSLNNIYSNFISVGNSEHKSKYHDISGDNNPARRFPEKNIFKNKDFQEEMRIKYHIGAKRPEKARENIRKAVNKNYESQDLRDKIGKHTTLYMSGPREKFEEFLKRRANNKLLECRVKTDLPCFLEGNKVMVKKVCKGCGREFVVSFGDSKSSYHSMNCWLKNQKGISYPNRGRRKANFNHSVVSVKFVGYEDVYNMTVDEFHNYAVITSNEDNRKSGIIIKNCGEQPLLSWESCNLGSIDVSKFVKDEEINWNKLLKTTEIAVRFLDNVIDVNRYPRVKIARKTLATRKIGLGIMGWADLLIAMKVKYDSEEALNLAEKLMSTINNHAHRTSEQLAKEKGYFPAFNKIIKRRNATLTTIAPTGTLSMLAGCSGGIEPIFAKKFTKKVLGNIKMDLSKKYGDITGDYFVTALEIKPEWHVRMQGAFQKYVDNAVSKTINMSYDAKVEDVKKTIYLSYDLGCKGLTLYRNGTRDAPIEISTEGLSECDNGKCSI